LGGKAIKVSVRYYYHRDLFVSAVKRWACQYSMACSV
jgi:hypothetical protein